MHLVNVPESSRDGVRIKIVTSSICGSDFHIMNMGIVEGRILGHEFAGTTPDGIAVAVEPLSSCGECPPCSEGYRAHCHVKSVVTGVFEDGGMAEYVVMPEETLVELPTGLDIGCAALVEPLAVAVHGLDRARVREGDRVLVIGAGPIGLAAAAALNARGLAYDISARHDHQKAAAEEFGANLAVADGYDVVIDAVGTGDSLLEAIQRVKPQGRVGVLGTFWNPTNIPFEFSGREIELIASVQYQCKSPNRNFEEAANMLLANPKIADAMITHRFPLDACTEAFATAANRADGAIKVVFDL